MQILLDTEYDEFLESLVKKPRTSIRLNTQKPMEDNFSSEKIPWTKHGFYLNERPNFTFDYHFHLGKYYVQEASSMILEAVCRQIFPSSSNLKIADLCAAPGGKTTLLSSFFYGNEHIIIANEIDGKRNSILQENIIKWGLDNVFVSKNKLEDFEQIPETFDFVLLDAPCSGEGMFRKDNFAVSQWSNHLINQCSFIQENALKSAIATLKIGGYLMYSTCTFNTTENEKKLQYCIDNFDVESVPISLQDEFGFKTINVDKSTMYKAFPHKVQGEGFSFFVLRKLSNKNTVEIKRRNIKSNILNWKCETKSQFDFKDERQFIAMNDKKFALPNYSFDTFNVLASFLYFTYLPTLFGTAKAEKLLPHQAYLLSVYSKPDFTEVEISREEVLKYFASQTFPIDNHDKGVQVLKYKHEKIGFIHNIGNRFNNLYPSEWRIKNI